MHSAATHTSHFSVTATFICIVPLYQPPWFIPSLPHLFKNMDNNKQQKYSWCFLFPCQYHPSQNVQNVHGMVCHEAEAQSTCQRGLNVSIGQSQLPLRSGKDHVLSFFPHGFIPSGPPLLPYYFSKLMQMILLFLCHIWFKWADTNPKVMAEEGHGHRHLTFVLAFLTETKCKFFNKVVWEEKTQ